MPTNVRPIALVLSLAVWLTGCAKTTSTNTATIVIAGLSRHPQDHPILVDPSLNAEVDETRGVGFFWDTKQRVVINATGPLKLIPVIPGEPVFDKVGTTHTATIVVNSLFMRPGTPILIDPCLIPERNEMQKVWSIPTSGNDITQRVEIHSRVPLRLVPASPEEAERLTAVEKGFQPAPVAATRARDSADD